MKLARLIVLAVNVFLFACGAILTALGGWSGNIANSNFRNMVSPYALWLFLACGIFLVAFSLIAFMAVRNLDKGWAKMYLLIYSLLLIVVLAIELAAAVAVFTKRDELSNCATNDYDSTACPDAGHQIRDLVNITMTTCCGNPSAAECVWAKSVTTSQNCGSAPVFKRVLLQTVTDSLSAAAGVAVAIGAVQIIVTISTCALILHKDEDEDYTKSPPMEPPIRARAVLLVTNAVLMCLGIAVLALGAKLYQLGDSFSDVLPSNAPAMVMIMGIFIVVLSLTGCLGAAAYEKKWAKVLLVVYDVLLLIVIIIELIGGFLIFSILGDLKTCQSSPIGTAQCNSYSLKVDKWVNTTRDTCCHHRSDSACSWASKVVTDDTCTSFKTFKGALLQLARDQAMPLALFAVTIAFIQLTTLFSTCVLIRAKGRALLTGDRTAYYYQDELGAKYYRTSQVAVSEAQSQETPGALPEHWAYAYDEKGRIYYYHMYTRQTQWERPTAY